MKRTAHGLCFAGLLFAVAFAAPALAGMDSDRLLEAGREAPGFTFSDVATGAVTPFESVGRGKPLMLVFLQTACQSCFREMMTLKALAQNVPDLQVLGIFLDMKPKDFQKYISENGFPFVFGWDSGYTIASAYGVSFTPASFLLGPDRKVVKVYKGFHPGIEQAIKSDISKISGK